MLGVEDPELVCAFHVTNFFLSHSNLAARPTEDTTVTRMKANRRTTAMGR